uniref:Ig-like domain-containing protein n=1 Tax=Gopherus agassizii TaxID=38772 RepID=A0A452IRX1_9SAUR
EGAGGTLSVCHSALLEAVRISAKGQQVLYLAQGDSVRLGCPYILEPQDNGPTNLDIIWTMVNPEQRLPFLTYQDQKIRYGSVPGLQQRVSFVAQDPSLYDASIHLANLQVSDSATYECRVRKATVDTHLITITVLEKPAAPRCWMDGEPVRGGNLMLRCCSDGGSLPLSYQWSKMGGDYAMGWLPPRTVQGKQWAGQGSPGGGLLTMLSSLWVVCPRMVQGRGVGLRRVGCSSAELEASPCNVYDMSFLKSWHPGDPFHRWSSQGVFGGGPRHGPDVLPGGSGCLALSQDPLGVKELALPVRRGDTLWSSLRAGSLLCRARLGGPDDPEPVAGALRDLLLPRDQQGGLHPVHGACLRPSRRLHR